MLLYSRASAVSGHHIITMETRHLSLSPNVALGNVLTSLLADRQTRGERKKLLIVSRHGRDTERLQDSIVKSLIITSSKKLPAFDRSHVVLKLRRNDHESREVSQDTRRRRKILEAAIL